MSILGKYLSGKVAGEQRRGQTENPMAAMLGSSGVKGNVTEDQIIRGLVQRGISPEDAAGIAANMIVESSLNTGINEKNPLVNGSRGGYGLNQWTGPRRVAYENFAASRGVSPDDLDTQLDFTVWELQNTESGAWNALQRADNPMAAAQVYSDLFLRPGIPHMDRRLAEARRLAANPMASYAGM